jgi:hypothetical protein
MQTETVVGTITHIDHASGLIDLQTAEARPFSMPMVLLESSGFECTDLVLVGDRLQVIAEPVATYQVKRVIGMIPKLTERPRGIRGSSRERATRQVLQHLERARCNLGDCSTSRLTNDGVLAYPHHESIACQVAQEELAKAIAIIERTWGRPERFCAAGS